MTNPYDDILQRLHDNHIYPAKETLVKKKGTETVGLHVQCSPIFRDTKKDYLRKLLPEDTWLISWIGNDNDYIKINYKKKQPCLK